jgi:hypothetical protein
MAGDEFDQGTLQCSRRCGHHNLPLRGADSFDRIALAGDPADPNCGHHYVEAVYVMRCPACGHRQELVARRTPYATLAEAQRELDAHLLGKG